MSSSVALCRVEESVLLIVDIQERLAAAMPEDSRETVFRNAGILLDAARLLDVPVILTEQYPKGLGPTASAVTTHLGGQVERLEKTVFSCCGADDFSNRLASTGRRQVLIAGMEAHVCVLQTALELLGDGHEVFVVEDAICSRNPANHHNAVERIRQAGGLIASTESVVFEWLRHAGHEHFKTISKLVRYEPGSDFLLSRGGRG